MADDIGQRAAVKRSFHNLHLLPAVTDFLRMADKTCDCHDGLIIVKNGQLLADMVPFDKVRIIFFLMELRIQGNHRRF